MASPLLERLLHHHQQLVAPSTRRTYQAEVHALRQFCELQYLTSGQSQLHLLPSVTSAAISPREYPIT